ncbi:MAG: hypothetical protein AAGF48_14905 [Pseudomonadota bacterium]
MPSIKLKVYPYMTSGGDPVEVEAPCRIVGDLAVHRPYSAWKGEASPMSGWTVTHVGTGLSAGKALHNLTSRGAGQREHVKWARDWQEACPAFFKAWREGDNEKAQGLAQDAFEKAIAL